MLKALPYFKEQRTDITWTLYLAHFFEWKSSCESTYSRKQLLGDISQSTNIASSLEMVATFSILFLVLFCCMSCCHAFCHPKLQQCRSYRYGPPNEQVNRGMFLCFLVFKYIVYLLTLVALIIFAIQATLEINRSKQPLVNFDGLTCSDPFSNAIFSSFENSVTHSSKWTARTIYLGILGLL